jgi:2-oxo-4-hydroxy-4-carboxy--5-ureidoimidazoline (OHCU) decarboxylase
MTDATDEVRRELAEGHREYERKFGRIFIVSASGKTAEELLANLRRRLGNTPAEELSIAAREQGMITELRLARLLSDPNAS